MEKKQCPFCGKTVLSISKVCKHCSKSFEQPTRNESSKAATDTLTPPFVEPQIPVAQQTAYSHQQTMPHETYGHVDYANSNLENSLRNQNFTPPKPDNYLIFAILATVFCCIPVGIVSIVYASQVNSAYNIGDFDRAQSASNNAKYWLITTAIAGAIYWAVMAYIGNKIQ